MGRGKLNKLIFFEIGLDLFFSKLAWKRWKVESLINYFFRNWLGKGGKWIGIILIYFSDCSGKVERRMLYKLIILEIVKIIYEVDRGKI